jgi:hypothetical protein
MNCQFRVNPLNPFSISFDPIADFPALVDEISTIQGSTPLSLE